MMMNEARIEVLETAIKLKDEEIARLKKALDSWMSKGQDDQAEIYGLKNEISEIKKDHENAMDLINDYERQEMKVRTLLVELDDAGTFEAQTIVIEKLVKFFDGDGGVEKPEKGVDVNE